MPASPPRFRPSSSILRAPRIFLGACALATLLAPSSGIAAPLAAPSAADLAFYSGEAIITGRDIPSERLRGYRMALPRVVAKVSGDSQLANAPSVQSAIEHADTLVRDVSFIDRLAKKKLMDEQGTRERSFLMTVQFDPASIDRLIRAAGRHPWPWPRPTIRVSLRITDTLGPFLLSDNSPRGTGQREVITDVSRRLGVPVVLSGDQFPPPQAEAILTGDMTLRPEGGWTTQWTLVSATLPQPRTWDSPSGPFDHAIANGLEETARALATATATPSHPARPHPTLPR